MSAIVQNDVKLPFHTENIQKKKKTQKTYLQELKVISLAWFVKYLFGDETRE